MATETTTPTGYWQDANGSLIPETKVKDIDKLRHQVVTDLCTMAEKSRDGLAEFKALAMQEVAALVSTSMEQYGVSELNRERAEPGGSRFLPAHGLCRIPPQ